MTPETVRQLVVNKDIPGFVAAMAPLSEAERKELRPVLEELRHDVHQPLASQDREGYLCRIGLWQLAYAALGAKQETLDWGIGGEEEMDEQLYSAYGQVLLDRDAPWLDEIISRGVSFETVLIFKSAGRITEDHMLGVATSIAGTQPWRIDSVSERLPEHPDLLESLYRIFEIDMLLFYHTNDAPSLAAYGWPRVLLEFCNRGMLDRSRLLSKLTKALANDTRKESFKGFMAFHGLLVIDNSFRKPLEDEYLAFLSSEHTALVGFAVSQLKALEKAKLLDGEAFIRELPRIFSCSAKKHPKAALSLLKTVVKQHGKLKGAATLAAAEGMTHEHEDVQDAAMKLIESWAEAGDIQLAEILAACRDRAAAPIQLRIDALLTELRGGELAGPDSEIETGSNASLSEDAWRKELAARRSRTDCLPVQIRKLHGLDEVMAGIEQGRIHTATTWTLLDAPLLTCLQPIQPIETVDELFDAVAHALEHVDSGDEVERILDGLSRLCDQRPGDFDQRAKPIVKRIEKILGLQNPSRALLFPSFDRGIARLLMAWLTGSSHGVDDWAGFGNYGSWCQCAIRRCRALAERVENRIAAPLLSAPTHQDGWIDPEIWSDRWSRWCESKLEVPEIELAQSLLRFTPDRRAAALERLPADASPYRDAVRWALGAEFEPKRPLNPAGVWIAASRARDRFVQLDGKLFNERLAGPDVLEPARYTWKACTGNRAIGRIVHSDEGAHPHVVFDITPPLNVPRAAASLMRLISPAAKVDFKLLTVMSHSMEPGYDPKWSIQWSSMLWPATLDGYWVCATGAFLTRIDQKPSSFEPHSAYLDPLFHPDRALSELAALALWTATLSKDSDSRTAAIDAWAELITDGRGDIVLLSDTLIRIAEGGWLQLNRVADSLREVSRISPLHAWTAAEILQDLLGSMSELPRDAHHILQLLRELLVGLGLDLREELRKLLTATKGGGKTGKLTRDLAKLARTEHPDRNTALLRLVDARLERAERWWNAFPERDSSTAYH